MEWGEVSGLWNFWFINSICVSTDYTYYRGTYRETYQPESGGASTRLKYYGVQCSKTPQTPTPVPPAEPYQEQPVSPPNVAASCPVGYTHDGAGRCYANPTCPSGGPFDGTLDVCHLTYSKSCPVGMVYDSVSNACLMNPTCSVGTLNTTTDKCGTTYACPSGSSLDNCE